MLFSCLDLSKMSTVKTPEPIRIQVKPVARELLLFLMNHLMKSSFSFIHQRNKHSLPAHMAGTAVGIGDREWTKMDQTLILVGPASQGFFRITHSVSRTLGYLCWQGGGVTSSFRKPSWSSVISQGELRAFFCARRTPGHIWANRWRLYSSSSTHQLHATGPWTRLSCA